MPAALQSATSRAQLTVTASLRGIGSAERASCQRVGAADAGGVDVGGREGLALAARVERSQGQDSAYHFDMASREKPLMAPGNEAKWAELNREKREYHIRTTRALTPSERVAQGQKLSQQAVEILASTIRAGHVTPRAFWS